MFPVTAFIASVLAIFYVHLSFVVIKLRRTHKILLGDGNIMEITRAIRAHANFAEYVPLTLILFACLESANFSKFVLLIFGAIFIAARIVHVRGISRGAEGTKHRIQGMKLTFAIIIISALLNLAYVMEALFAINLSNS